VFLHSGRVYSSREPQVISTILGSCVSVCLFDRSRAIGGMNHFLLPSHASDGERSPRFGAVALQVLLEQMSDLGATHAALVAKVFGGARVGPMVGPITAHLGQRNIETAQYLLEKARIPIVASDVGGTVGRKLLFETATGSAWVKLIGASP
jgi:chemotaxis protein CheD